MLHRPLVFAVWGLAALTAIAASRVAPPRVPLTDVEKIERAREYAAAVAKQEYAAAKTMLAPNARVWYEKREGEGEPLNPGGGTWTHWDTYFHGRTTYSDWRVDGGAVLATATETNDFYRLLDWRPWPMLFTWWLDEEARIAGFMVQARPGKGSTGSRLADVVAWAKAKHPEEIAYLMPKGRIDPTADRAERWRKLLVEWRREAKLPAVERHDEREMEAGNAKEH
jgi:hypothetical protein